MIGTKEERCWSLQKYLQMNKIVARSSSLFAAHVCPALDMTGSHLNISCSSGKLSINGQEMCFPAFPNNLKVKKELSTCMIKFFVLSFCCNVSEWRQKVLTLA